MLDIGWSELVLIGVVALIFVGPKDLPRMFHALGRFTAKARGMAREFQRAMDDAAKTSGLDEVRKDLGGVKAGISAATNPTGYGINALEDAARKFEKWDPKTVLKPAAAPTVAGGAVVTVGSGSAVAGTAVSGAPDAAVSSSGVSGSAASGSASEAVSGAVSGAGPETKALAEKRAADAAAARAKAYELQAKASQSATATFAARAKADAEAAAAKQAQADAAAASMADESAAAPAPKPRVRAKKAEAAPVSAAVDTEAAKPVRKPPVRRKKSDA